MKIDRSITKSNFWVLAVMSLTLAAVCGALGLAASDQSADRPGWSAISTAHAVTVDRSPANGRVTIVDAKADQPWAADESSRGTSPEASH